MEEEGREGIFGRVEQRESQTVPCVQSQSLETPTASTFFTFSLYRFTKVASVSNVTWKGESASNISAIASFTDRGKRH